MVDPKAVLEDALARGREADPEEVAEADSRLEELMERVAAVPERRESTAPSLSVIPLAGVAMRTATPLLVAGRTVLLSVRGVPGEVAAELADGVSEELVADAAKNGDAVVLECVPDAAPLVVGVLQTRRPEVLSLRANKVEIDAESELVLRSGEGAMRIRRGDVEIVGRRISALSRGLFRLVGRVLRLN